MQNKSCKIELLIFLLFVIILDIPFIVFGVQQGGLYLPAILISILIPFIINQFLNNNFLFILLSFPILYLSLSFNVLIFDFNSYYNISTWSAVFDTNPQESKEFLGIIRPLTIIISVLQIITFLLYSFYTYKFKKKTCTFIRKKNALLILLLLTGDYFINGITSKAFPFGHTLNSFIAYQKQVDFEQENYPAKKKYKYNAVENQAFTNDSLPRTIIVLITESMRRDHFGYYGYTRNTTPLMSREKLIIYRDMISPANQTVNVLRRVFSQAELNNDTLYFTKPSFITAFNEAGYYTAWLSTQSVSKNGESKNSVIAKECDTTIFRNNTHLDTILLDDIDRILQNKARKKLIFVHIFGTHYLYENRFPPEKAYFSKEKANSYKTDQINKYDDAYLYNDYFQFQILKRLKKQEGENLYITFSDHGESLFDSGPHIQGHGSLQPSKVEFNIPFVLWFSDEYKKNHTEIYNNILKNKDLPAINSDFFHSFPTLFGIEFDELKPENNYFSSKYTHRKNRKVVNSAMQILLYKNLKK